MKKVLPFLLVLVLPLYFAFATSSTNATAKNTETIGSGLLRVAEDQNIYLANTVFSKILEIAVNDLKTNQRICILKKGAWEYNRERSEVTLKDDIDLEKYYLVIKGIPETPIKFKLRDADFNSLVVFINENIALEGTDYTIDREKEELVFNKSFLPFEKIKYFISVKRKSVGAFCLVNYSGLPTLFMQEIIDRKNGPIKDYQVKMNEKGEPEIYVVEIKNNPPQGNVYAREKTEKSDNELSKEMGFKVVFNDLLGKYKLSNKFKTNMVTSDSSINGILANYFYRENSLSIKVNKEENFLNQLAKENETQGHQLTSFNISGQDVYFNKSYTVKLNRNYLFPKPAFRNVYMAVFSQDSLIHRIDLYDYNGYENEESFKELVNEYRESV